MLPSQRAYQAGTVGQEPTFRSRCEPGGFRPQVGRSPRRASDTGSGRPVASIVGKTHTGRTCCDKDLLKSSDHLILPFSRTGRGSLPGAIGALRSELLLEEVAHRGPRALVGLLVIEDRRVERTVGLGVGEAVQGVAI